MANAIYTPTREKLLLKTVTSGWEGGDFRALLVRTSGGGGGPYYTFSAAHDFLDDVPSNSDCRPAAAVALTESSPANDGTADADDWTFPLVPAGDAIQSIILYDHTGGADSARTLWAYYDTSTGLPVTPNGQDINVAVNASGLFKL